MSGGVEFFVNASKDIVVEISKISEDIKISVICWY